MTQRDQSRSYTIPLKIERIVEKNYEEMKRRLFKCSEGCPFYGYVLEQSSSEEIPIDLQGRCSISHPDLMGNDTDIRIDVQGCAALRDPACYLSEKHEDIRRGSHLRRPRISVDNKQTCPVYVRVLEEMIKLGEKTLKPESVYVHRYGKDIVL